MNSQSISLGSTSADVRSTDASGRTLRLLGVILLGVMISVSLSGIAFAQTASTLAGEYKAEFGDALGSSSTGITLTSDSSGSLTGHYALDARRRGTITLRLSNDKYQVFLNQPSAECYGSFVGEL